jgi:hypothetical protein
MLPNFDGYDVGHDPYDHTLPSVEISGEKPQEIKLSIMMSVYHRRSQLFRTLITLTNQNFRDFEVLVYDNDDDQNIPEILAMFEDVLEIRYFKKPAGTHRHFDPTPAFNFMFPHTRGDVVAIMQPECMLRSNACWHLYHGHNLKYMFGYRRYKIRDTFEAPSDGKGETCVTLKTLWLEDRIQKQLDTVSWWDNCDRLFALPGFYDSSGLAGLNNTTWISYTCQLWWLAFSFKRTASIWEHLKKFDYLRGHASIDFLLINLRDILDYEDVMPVQALAFHQEHHRMSVAPEGEQKTVSKEQIIERLKNG